MRREIESLAQQIVTVLAGKQPSGAELMHLKLEMGIAASKLFLACGWLLSERYVALAPSEFGYRISLCLEEAPLKVTENEQA